MSDFTVIDQDSSTSDRIALRIWGMRLGCLLLLTSAVGCFEKTYTDRMQVTIKFYEHMDVLNRNLVPEPGWSDRGFKIRVPLGFEALPKPEIPPPDPNNPMPPVDEDSLDDPRQPGYLGIKLPGMIGAWQKKVAVDEPGGAGTRMAYIYLLSNIKLFSVLPETPGRIDPTKFQEHTINLLAQDVGVQFKADDWRREDFPPPPFKLVQVVTGDSLMLLPERTFEETKMSFRIFITSQRDTQAILLFVYPDTTSALEKLTERINLSLETLRIPADAAAGAVTAPGTTSPAGAPAL